MGIRFALNLLSLAMVLPLAGCSGSAYHQPVASAGGSGCHSGYKPVATATTWRKLADKLADYSGMGNVAEVRTVERGSLTDSVGHHVARYVDLVDRRGHRILQVEVWRKSDGAWRAAYFLGCR